MNISPKTKGEIEFYLAKIKQKQFDQETLTGLLMTIREYAKPGSLTREIADFRAHPTRDRGIILNQVGMLKMESAVVSQKPTLQIFIPMPRDGKLLVEDLCQTLRDIGGSDDAIKDNHDDVLLCYFGVLHLARMNAGNGQVHTLKISHSHSYHEPSKTEHLSIVSISDTGTVLLIFNSNLNANQALDNLRLDNGDTKTILRVLRENQSLKIVKQPA